MYLDPVNGIIRPDKVECAFCEKERVPFEKLVWNTGEVWWVCRKCSNT